jgi:acyl-CoA thioesterase-1
MLRSSIIAFLLSFAAIANSNAQIVALGASSTAGYGVGASSAYPAQLEAILRARGRAMSVSNAGISGDTTGGMLARLSSAVPDGTKIVILQIAGNDAMKGMSSPTQRQTGPRSAGGCTPAAFAPSKPMAMFSRRFEAD